MGHIWSGPGQKWGGGGVGGGQTGGGEAPVRLPGEEAVSEGSGGDLEHCFSLCKGLVIYTGSFTPEGSPPK